MIVEALEASTGNLESLASELGVSYDTLWAWKSGRRTPTPRNLKRLAVALNERGAKLLTLAADLERAADSEG